MIDSQSKRFAYRPGGVIAALGLTLALGLSHSVNAQTSLSPKGESEDKSTPPAMKVTDAPPPIITIRKIRRSRSKISDKVSVEELQTIDPDSVGTLTEEQGGFGIDMWAGASRVLVENLLPKLPVNSSSRTMRDLMRRLLLSTATAPERNKKTKSLIAIRAQQLSAMGDNAAVVQLIRVSPTRGKDEVLMRSEADVLFLSNDNARVCPLVASQIGNTESAYWQKAFIFCQSLAGEHEKASLGASLLREQGEEDEVFFGLVDSLAGLEKFEIKSLINPLPLHFAMVRAAKVKLPTDVSSSNNPAILRTIATSPNAHPELRVDAAERAENMGALKTDILRQLYAGVTFSEQALDNPLTTADATRGPLSRALLYRKALVESIPTAMAEVLSQALKQARETARYQSMSRVYLEILTGLEPTKDLVWFAPEAVRALLAAGALEAADNWFRILRSSALFNQDAIQSRNRLAPLARIAGALDDEDWTPELLAGWWRDQITPEVKKEDSQAPNNPGDKAREKQLSKSQLMERAHSRALLLYNILEALGDEVPDSNWVSLLNSPPQTTTLMPQPALWRSLSAAADRGRIGEVVLYSMLALGQGGPAQANPTVLRKVLTSLSAVGLNVEARALALEAAIASGI